MNGIGLIVIAGIILLLLIMMAGRKTKYFCDKCGAKWKAIRHHKGTVKPCPKCGNWEVKLR